MKKREKIYKILEINDAANKASWWNIADEILNLQAKTIEDIKKNIGFLRQWLNEKPKDRLVTNKDIEKWLFK